MNKFLEELIYIAAAVIIIWAIVVTEEAAYSDEPKPLTLCTQKIV